MDSSSSVPSPPVPTGLLVYDSDGDLSYADDTACSLLGCDDASHEACHDVASPVVERAVSTPSAAPYVTDGPTGRLLVQTDPVSDDGPLVVRLLDAEAVHDLSAVVRSHKRTALLEPLYRAYTHDARNPVIASQLQIGILRELDADALAKRSERFADTIERHLNAVGDALTDLIDELVDRNDDPAPSVNTIVDRVVRLAEPYARQRSTSIEVTLAEDDVATRTSLSEARRALLGLTAHLLGSTGNGDTVCIGVDAGPAANESGEEDGTGPTITLAGPTLNEGDDFAVLLHAARADLARTGGHVDVDRTSSPPRVHLHLPRA